MAKKPKPKNASIPKDLQRASVEATLVDEDLDAGSQERTLGHLFKYRIKGQKKSAREMMVMGVLKTANRISQTGIESKEDALVMKEVFMHTDPKDTGDGGPLRVVIEEANDQRAWSAPRSAPAQG